MKNLLVLALLLSGAARADAFTAAPMKGFGLCPVSSGSGIAVSSDSEYLPSTFKLRLAESINTKLTAYRITKDGRCDGASTSFVFPEINIVLTEPIANGARGYAVVTKVWHFEKGGAIDLWSTISAGVSIESGVNLADRIQQIVGGQFDKLAADYAIANP